MIDWLLSLDWSWLFGPEGLSLAFEVVLTRSVVSVTGVATGKRYGEIVFDTIVDPDGAGAEGYVTAGIILTDYPSTPRVQAALGTNGYIWFSSAETNSPTFSDGPTFSASDVAMFAVDTSNGKVWLGKVGTGWYNGGDPAAGTGETGTIAVGTNYLAAAIERVSTQPIGGSQFSLRTQSSQFTGAIPSGFSAWYP
jgi:hypothetical protein